jgi:hypothetical protein
MEQIEVKVARVFRIRPPNAGFSEYQTEEEKQQRRAIRKKIKRWKALGLDTTELEQQFEYRTTAEFRQATCAGGKQFWAENPDDPRKETYKSEEFISSARACAKRAWEDPAFQERRHIANLKYYSMPEARAQHSAIMKKALDNPEFRAKCSQRIGPLSNAWKGGLSFEPYCHKFTREFRRNVRHFFEHKCVLCLYEGGEMYPQKGLLNVHHVHYDKRSLCNETSPRMFAPLCDSHHGMTNGDREFWETLLEDILTDVYNGQSFYCEEQWAEIKVRLNMPEIAESSDPQELDLLSNSIPEPARSSP